MGFADAYLHRAGVRGPLVASDPHPGLNIIVTIPVHNETGLNRCLDSLFSCICLPDGDELSHPIQAEVLILINAHDDSPEEVLEQNLHTQKDTLKWIKAHPHPSIQFHVILDHTFKKKKSGVGMARKILMDEAARRFSRVGKPEGIIASLDADVVVDRSYLSVLVNHFASTRAEGCSIYFEHPLTPEEDPEPEKQRPAVYDAVAQYELHLRYYLNSVRSTGYPYAYQTVGSAFAVRVGIYCKEGGMNRRQGGEDFYFIQKVALRGRWSECRSTRVLASPRPSGRAPFGTGRMIHRLVREKPELATYNPGSFRILKAFFDDIDKLYKVSDGGDLSQWLPEPRGTMSPEVLGDFLLLQNFRPALLEIRSNSASLPAFRKRFWRWFNMFRIMKFLHYAREHGYPDVEVTDAVRGYLRSVSIYRHKHRKLPTKARDLLVVFRLVDLSSEFIPG